ncbi:MAG: hypothetical protein QM754_18275 [Tepidisphaeraceae bacterium]
MSTVTASTINAKFRDVPISDIKVAGPASNFDLKIVNEFVVAMRKVSENGGHLVDYLSPWAIFNDFTFLGTDTELAERISKRCMSCGDIPLIDQHPTLGLVFHTLFPCRTQTVHKKKIAAEFERLENKCNEKQVERELVTRLLSEGVSVATQVRTPAGWADIVTESHVIEVELRLSRSKIFEAVGQVLLYSAAIGGGRQPAIAGKYHADVDILSPFIKQIGVEVILCK